MEADFWLDRWHRGQIGFHQPRVSRHLSEHWPNLAGNSNIRVFVPLCGKSLDLAWLRDRGHFVVGVEISEIALEAFCMDSGIPARRRSGGLFDIYEAFNLQFFCGDFFDLDVGQLGNVDAIYDRAALISWNIESRDSYARHITSLTSRGARTLLVTMEYSQEQMTGPPFCVSPSEVDRLYARHHSIQELSRDDILAAEPRMRARGVTQLHEVCYQLTRL